MSDNKNQTQTAIDEKAAKRTALIQTMREAAANVTDVLFDLADVEVDSDADHERIDNARALARSWVIDNKAPAVPPGDLLFAVGVLLDTIKLPALPPIVGTIGMGDGPAPLVDELIAKLGQLSVEQLAELAVDDEEIAEVRMPHRRRPVPSRFRTPCCACVPVSPCGFYRGPYAGGCF